MRDFRLEMKGTTSLRKQWNFVIANTQRTKATEILIETCIQLEFYTAHLLYFI